MSILCSTNVHFNKIIPIPVFIERANIIKRLLNQRRNFFGVWSWLWREVIQTISLVWKKWWRRRFHWLL